MTERTKYPHCPMCYGDSIRLIHLQPAGSENDSIKFSLHDARLSDAKLGYEALSYTWGAEYPKHTIFRQDPPSTLQVTEFLQCFDASP